MELSPAASWERWRPRAADAARRASVAGRSAAAAAARAWAVWRARAAALRAGAAAFARRPEALFLFAGLAAGAAATAFGGRPLPLSGWAPYRVALTFDDGPHPFHTRRLLDILRAGGARATFFVVGRQAVRHPPLLDQVLRRGSELANHTYNHPALPRLRRADLLTELEDTRRLLDAAGARGPRFFRPPGGRFDAKVLATARAAGYRMVLWTVLPRDHEAPSAEMIRRRVLDGVRDGGVVLLHSGVESTEEALPGILKELHARGFRCVSVGELLSEEREAPAAGEDGAPPEPREAWLDPAAAPRRPARERPPEEVMEP